MGVPLPACLSNLSTVLIGFGPQRTGTSAMTLLTLGIAQTTGLVALANATRGGRGRSCCSTETYFWLEDRILTSIDAPRYCTFFDTGSRFVAGQTAPTTRERLPAQLAHASPQQRALTHHLRARAATVAYEKTPKYAISRTAPLSVIAVLPARVARFIYTFRELGDTIWSMHVHSGARRLKTTAFEALRRPRQYDGRLMSLPLSQVRGARGPISRPSSPVTYAPQRAAAGACSRRSTLRSE